MEPLKDGSWLGKEIDDIINEASSRPYWLELDTGEGILRVYEPEEMKNMFKNGEVILSYIPVFKGILKYYVNGKEHELNDLRELKKFTEKRGIDIEKHIKKNPEEFAKIVTAVTGIGSVVLEREAPRQLGIQYEIPEEEPLVGIKENDLVFIVKQSTSMTRLELKKVTFSIRKMRYEEEILAIAEG